MIVLGVDTSLRSTGYGVLEAVGSRLRAIDYGNIPNAREKRVSDCLAAIHDKIASLISAYAPEEASLEKVIYGKNANTMCLLGEARGAVIVAASSLPIYEYEPRRVKMAVCGNGLAGKEQIQRMVKTLLALPALPQNDAADALALAICHVHARETRLGARQALFGGEANRV